MKNILLPTDFSRNSWNAINYAIALFGTIPCNFYLLHVATNDVNNNDIVVKQEQLKSWLKRIEKIAPNTDNKFHLLLEEGLFIEAIRAHVALEQIDVIVMGIKGISNAKTKVIGTIAIDVITKVKCPVLVIPEKAQYHKIQQVVFPTDYNTNYKESLLKTIFGVLSTNNAALSILHLSKSKQELSDVQLQNKASLENYLNNTIEHSFHSSSSTYLEEAVERFVKREHIDLILMNAKKLNFFQKILFHPSLEKISYHDETPFLVLH